MYLHIGGNVSILMKNIVAILDIEKTTISQRTRDFLKINEQNKKIISVSNELPSSFVVTEDFVYISPISVGTLIKRGKENDFGEVLNILPSN